MSSDKTITKRGFHPRAVGHFTRKLTRPALRLRGFRDVDILAHWQAIVGSQLAGWSRPERLSHYGRDGATLTVRVEGAMALEVQHYSAQILARINQYYGDNVVKKLQIIQAPLTTHVPVKPAAPLRQEEIDHAAARLDMPEGELKQALARLGAHIARREG